MSCRICYSVFFSSFHPQKFAIIGPWCCERAENCFFYLHRAFFLSFSLCVVLSVSEELLWRRNCHCHSWPRFYTDFLVSNFHSFLLCSVCNMRKALIVFSSRDLFSFFRCCAFLLFFDDVRIRPAAVRAVSDEIISFYVRSNVVVYFARIMRLPHRSLDNMSNV